MKINSYIRHAPVALLIWAGAVSTAFAAGGDTNAGTSISNTATVNFQVGGVSQTAVTGLDTFVVDRKINLTVAETAVAAGTGYNANPVGTYINVAPGSVDQPLYFTVTNLTNGTIDIRLGFTHDAGSGEPYGTPDNYNASNNDIYLDDGDGVFEPGGDDGSPILFLDNVAEDGISKVWVAGDTTLAQANGSISTGTLTAYSNSDGSGGAANDYTETGSDTAGSVDTVLADGAGDTDAARDGDFSDDDGWQVSSATPIVSKSSTVVTDPINCTVPGTPGSCTGAAKRIPGAIVEYCIDVNNTAGTAADSVVITDPVPASTTFISGSIRTAVPGTGAACTLGAGTAEDDDATGADDTTGDGGSHNGGSPGTVTITTPSVAGGARFRGSFRVQIN